VGINNVEAASCGSGRDLKEPLGDIYNRFRCNIQFTGCTLIIWLTFKWDIKKSSKSIIISGTGRGKSLQKMEEQTASDQAALL